MKRFSQLAAPYVVWVALMILLPMLLILFYAFTDSGNGVVNFTFTLDHFIRFFTDHDFLLILWRSLVIAFKTTVICILLGYPIAYFIARSSDRVRNILVLVITLPTWINMLVRTYAWIGILTQGGLLSNILGFFGLGETELLYTESAVLIGMVYNFIPFMILQINTSLCKMDHSLLEASADLGANKVQTFWRVTFPLSLPGVAAGAALVFIPVLGMFAIPDLVGGTDGIMIGNLIKSQFLDSRDWPFGSALSIALTGCILLLVALGMGAARARKGGAHA